MDSFHVLQKFQTDWEESSTQSSIVIQNLLYLRRACNISNINDIKDFYDMNYMHDNEVNEISEWNLLNDILNYSKHVKKTNYNYYSILNGFIDTLRGEGNN